MPDPSLRGAVLKEMADNPDMVVDAARALLRAAAGGKDWALQGLCAVLSQREDIALTLTTDNTPLLRFLSGTYQ